MGFDDVDDDKTIRKMMAMTIMMTMMIMMMTMMIMMMMGTLRKDIIK